MPVSREDVQIRVGTDTSAVARGLENMRRSFANLGRQISGIFSGTAIVSAFKGVFDMADRIQDTAEAIGESTDFVQGWEAALGKMGISGDKAAAGMEKLARGIAEARAKGELFEGIEVGAKSTSEVLFELSDRMQAYGSSTSNAATSTRIFGRGMGELGAFMAQGSDAMKKLIADTRKVSETQLESLARAREKMEEWSQALQKGLAFLGGSFGEFFQLLAFTVSRFGEFFRDFLSGKASLSDFFKIDNNIRKDFAAFQIEQEEAFKKRRQAQAEADKADRAAEAARGGARAVAEKNEELEKLAKIEKELAQQKLSDEEKLQLLLGERKKLEDELAQTAGMPQTQAFIEAEIQSKQRLLEVTREIDQLEKSIEQTELRRADLQRNLGDAKKAQADALQEQLGFTVDQIANTDPRTVLPGAPRQAVAEAQRIKLLEQQRDLFAKIGNFPKAGEFQDAINKLMTGGAIRNFLKPSVTDHLIKLNASVLKAEKDWAAFRLKELQQGINIIPHQGK